MVYCYKSTFPKKINKNKTKNCVTSALQAYIQCVTSRPKDSIEPSTLHINIILTVPDRMS